VHPIEYLRYVARAGDVNQAHLVREAADALGSLRGEPGDLLISCRRIVDRHPMAGALWTLTARVLVSPNPDRAAWLLADELDADPTASEVTRALPDEAVVCIVGWPDLVADELGRRGDVQVRVIDAYGEGAGLARHLDARGVNVVEVPLTGLGAAVAGADVLLVEAAAASTAGCISPSGARAAAAVAATVDCQTWLVAGAGRCVPPPIFDVICGRLDVAAPWESDEEFIPATLFDNLLGPDGCMPIEALAGRQDSDLAPELLRAPI
jgi:hypothetical protein